MDDSDEVPGLAHLLEHLLIKGSRLNPQANYFEDFIDHHGGSHNAVTTEGLQYYHWDILCEHLAPALDM